jgi:hypothetical protein
LSISNEKKSETKIIKRKKKNKEREKKRIRNL